MRLYRLKVQYKVAQITDSKYLNIVGSFNTIILFLCSIRASVIE